MKKEKIMEFFSSLGRSLMMPIATLAVAGLLLGLSAALTKPQVQQIIPFLKTNGVLYIINLTKTITGAILGQITPFIWIPVSRAINNFGNSIANLGHIGIFIFGFLERALIPTGLHHILNSIFRTTPVGGAYNGVEGCLNIFLQFFDKVDISELRQYTSFLGQGKMPIMIFGLPAAAYAIYKTTPADKKTQVKALMIAGVATSVVSGITEPLEFSFMFVAPVLFLFHSIMAGLSFGFMSLFGAGIGNTGGGIIDMIIYGVIQPGSRWWLILILGPIFAVIYYFVFKIYLEKKNIIIEASTSIDEKAENNKVVPDVIEKIILGLGGDENIVEVNNCFSRLRVDVKDIGKLNENLIKTTGSMGIVKLSNTHVQIIYGAKVENIANNVHKILGK